MAKGVGAGGSTLQRLRGDPWREEGAWVGGAAVERVPHRQTGETGARPPLCPKGMTILDWPV